MKQFLFLELFMFNFPISLDYKNRFKSILVSKHYVNFDFAAKRLTIKKMSRMIDVIAQHCQ